ncbi:hypothetical protein [uncultured Cyclobacterium sp.]|uniref:hypothetical protein n=1 Tax=uncultured Cyclobacterium sp. TaxID=453820 RepID=UPI0030EE3F10
MKNKVQYFQALSANRGQHNEIDLGEQIGLDEQETQAILALLLSENKIKYERKGVCNYSLMKTKKK